MGIRGDFIIFSVLVLFLIPFINAETAFYVKQNTNYSIGFTCEIDGAVCGDGATCNISISYPNSSILIKNNVTTNLGNSEFEYNLTDEVTETKGEHPSTLVCYNGNTNGTENFIYEVNPTGIRPTEERTQSITRSIYFLFGIGIILFLVFAFGQTLSPPVKWTFFIFGIMFWLIAINIIFVSLQDEVVNPRLENLFDSLSAFSFFFLWFSAGLLIIMWAFAFLNTWIFKKNLANAKRYGLS